MHFMFSNFFSSSENRAIYDNSEKHGTSPQAIDENTTWSLHAG
jgi:hypothetical protein